MSDSAERYEETMTTPRESPAAPNYSAGLTVADLMADLKKCHPNWTVHPYEGEGCFIVIKDETDQEVRAWACNPS